jgi:membrane protease YdiL (CAAX protease family)
LKGAAVDARDMSESVADANRKRDAPGSDRDWRTVGRALGVALALWVAGPVVGNLLGAIPVVVVVLQQGGVPDQLPAWALLVGQVLLDGTFLVVGVVYARRYLGGFDLSLPSGDDRRWVALGLGGALTVWLASTGVSQVLNVEAPTSTVTTAFTEPWALVAFAVLGVVFVPLAEEVLFRGAIQRRLGRTLGRWPAVVLASFAFLSVHLLNYVGGSVLGLGLAFGTLFTVSVVIGYVYERADSLSVPVVVHVTYNAVVFAVGLAGLLG